MTFPSRWIAETLQIPHPPGRERTFRSILSDSRRVTDQDFFVALPGERVDGSEFIPSVLSKGAKGFLIGVGHPLPSSLGDALAFQVPDPLIAYRALSAKWRAGFRIPMGAIAGAVGKTSTKEFLASLLSGLSGPILKTEASQNGYVGIPMTLLELRSTHAAAAIEVGIDEPGAMRAHLEIVRPTAGLLTAIEEEHLEKLRDIETVEKEEGILFEFLSETGGTAVINLDDRRITRVTDRLRFEKSLKVSLDGNPGAELRGSLAGSSLTLQGYGCDGITLSVPLPGRHQARNLLLAVGLARSMGVPLEKLASGLRSFQAPSGRLEEKTLPGGSTLLLDHYNASPASTRAAIETLEGNPKILCLGDLLELGTAEEALHRGLSDAIFHSGAAAVFLHGPRMKWLADELSRKGFQGTLLHSENPAELAQGIQSFLVPGAAVLLKGSRGMKMERVWEALEPLLRN